MNSLTIIGNLTRDPESRTNTNGNTCCNFDVAVNRRVKGQNEVTYFRVAAWGQTGENCQKYLSKGKKVAVVGPVGLHVYSGSDGQPRGTLELLANDVEFLSPVGTEGRGQAASAAGAPTFTAVENEEIPF